MSLQENEDASVTLEFGDKKKKKKKKELEFDPDEGKADVEVDPGDDECDHKYEDVRIFPFFIYCYSSRNAFCPPCQL